MKYIRITSRKNGTLLAEQLYFGSDQTKAILRFLAEYPEHQNCVVIAEPYNSEDNPKHFDVCLRCGCVN